MLKFSSKIRLVPTLNGLYVNTNATLLLVLSLWLVGVVMRSVEHGGDLSEIVVNKFTRVATRPEVFLHLRGSVHEISIIRANPAETKKLTVGNCPLAVIRIK